MVHEEKKAAKIVEELTMFFFTVGADKMRSGIERTEEGFKITFCSDYLPEYEHKLDKLEEYLSESKNEGMEDIYWELAGSGDPGESSQLLLVGMMIDGFEMKKENCQVTLKLQKKLRP